MQNIFKFNYSEIDISIDFSQWIERIIEMQIWLYSNLNDNLFKINFVPSSEIFEIKFKNREDYIAFKLAF